MLGYKVRKTIHEAPNFGHQWYFDIYDLASYKHTLLICSKCSYEVVYVYSEEKYCTNLATVNLFGLNKSFRGKIIETCEQALNIKNMKDALE